MSNPTSATLQQQAAQQQNASAPGADDAQRLDDEASVARLTALRIRGQHVDIDGDEAQQ